LKENPAYKEIDIEKELSKMDAWLSTPAGRGRKKTSRFVLNWLNRIDTSIGREKDLSTMTADDCPDYKPGMTYEEFKAGAKK
jgi:hypothetical protein